MDIRYLWFFLIVSLFLNGYLYFEYIQELRENYEQLKIDHSELESNYKQLTEDYYLLKGENERLKVQQKKLTEEVSYYLLEQGAIDFFGLKKYKLAYDLIKIVVCNKNPAIPFC